MTARAVLSFISAGERRFMGRMIRWPAPRWIRSWMICATRCGDGWLWYAMGAVLLLFGGPRRLTAVGAAALASAVGIALFLTLKRIVGRKRPCSVEPLLWASLTPPDQFSFPSGHSITAFAVAVSLGCFYPSLIPGLLFCAFSVAISRVILGMHYVSDVVAGSTLGAMLGYIVFRLFS